MMEIRPVQMSDAAFRRLRLCAAGGAPADMFWSNTSFCMLLLMLTAAEEALMRRWEADMKAEGLQVAMAAQRFYREPGYEQPMELFLIKAI